MRKRLSVLLCVFLFSCMVTGALAQSISCPEAHLVLTVPDDWNRGSLSGKDDPGLCLLVGNRDLTLSVYIDDTGGLLPDSFQVFTGDDTESFSVVLSGMQMTCVAGKSSEGNYRIYTWLDRRNQVQFYFLITGNTGASRSLIDEIMNSIEWK